MRTRAWKPAAHTCLPGTLLGDGGGPGSSGKGSLADEHTGRSEADWPPSSRPFGGSVLATAAGSWRSIPVTYTWGYSNCSNHFKTCSSTTCVMVFRWNVRKRVWYLVSALLARNKASALNKRTRCSSDAGTGEPLPRTSSSASCWGSLWGNTGLNLACGEKHTQRETERENGRKSGHCRPS